MTTIPPFLSHLKVERGYPVPYFVFQGEGKTDFRLMDARKQRVCLAHRKCAICSKPLDTIAYLISGPKGLANRVSSDTWMHKACAEFALVTCPHLAYLKHERREDDIPAEAYEAPHMDPDKPTELFLIKTDKYRIFTPPGGGVLINYRPLAFLKFGYVGNRLTQLGQWETVPLGMAWKNG